MIHPNVHSEHTQVHLYFHNSNFQICKRWLKSLDQHIFHCHSWVCSVCLYHIKGPTKSSWIRIEVRFLGKRQLSLYKSMNQGGGCIMVTSDGWPLGTDWKIPHLNSRQLEPCPMPGVQYQHRWSRQLEDTAGYSAGDLAHGQYGTVPVLVMAVKTKNAFIWIFATSRSAPTKQTVSLQRAHRGRWLEHLLFQSQVSLESGSENLTIWRWVTFSGSPTDFNSSGSGNLTICWLLMGNPTQTLESTASLD